MIQFLYFYFLYLCHIRTENLNYEAFFLTSLFAVFITLGLFSATVDTVKVFSPSMNKEVKTVVIQR